MKLAFPSQTGSSSAWVTCAYGTFESRDNVQMFIGLSLPETRKSRDRLSSGETLELPHHWQKAEGQERFCQTQNLRGEAVTH